MNFKALFVVGSLLVFQLLVLGVCSTSATDSSSPASIQSKVDILKVEEENA